MAAPTQVEAIEAGDRRVLARSLRLVEERRPGWEELLAAAWPKAGHAHLVGMTGAPGSGKSTISNGLIGVWRAVDRPVGVLAVDPSSPFSGGALLGDRIRMQDHVSDPGVFVRSMSNRGRLGGLAHATAGLATLLDAGGFDPILIETVGVGQSEVDIVHQADSVVVVLTPGWGDSIQADKAGILEIGDIFVINKADWPGLEDTRKTVRGMLELAPAREWEPPIVATVASADEGIEELSDALDTHRRHLTVSAEGAERRRRRARTYIEWAFESGWRSQLDVVAVESWVEPVSLRRTDPWSAARSLLERPGSAGR